jgi:hypothetical protein
MLKSSLLCLYCSNLGTFWLKIEQFWPFEEISIFSNGDHLGYRTALTDTILKGDHLRIFFNIYYGMFLWTLYFCLFWPIMQIRKKGGWNKNKSSPLKLLSQFQPNFAEHLKKFPFLVMAAILDTRRRWRTQFWKGTTQGSFQQSLVEIGSVVSEEKIFLFFMNFELLPILTDYAN